MAKSKKSKLYNLIFIVIIALLLIPQTRQPIQVFINKGVALFVKPSVIKSSERKVLSSYDWTLKNMSNNTYDFKSAKGKVIVINFWATWCPPCIAEMPSLEKLYQHYKSNDDVVFLFVSNEDKEKLYEFTIHNNYSFEVYQSLTKYPKDFNVSSIPRTFIINRKGEIVIDKSGAADWNSERVIDTIDEQLKVF
ncbi:TlpA disulfide reductase family protein [uncultured Psychroserpens sp.]|uniref:TlpA family protein disulfide reductase n=1 Tax=uncultured Psychroserpens sp. TaxID=255436 RepID=UPI00260D4E97|nr:TlpA disulfide reductase family protein [uncultured Psychroserpens sp.]